MIETDDQWQEYTLWPYGEWERQHESEVTIEIKGKEKQFEDEVIKEINKSK